MQGKLKKKVQEKMKQYIEQKQEEML